MEAVDQLEQIARMCGEDGWDGRTAKRVKPDTLELARLFLDSMPVPDDPWWPTARPSGAIQLESGDRCVTVEAGITPKC